MKANDLALALSSLPKLIVVYRWHQKILFSFPLFAKTFGALSPIVFHTVFIFARRNIASLSWLYSMVAEIPPFGCPELNIARSIGVSGKHAPVVGRVYSGLHLATLNIFVLFVFFVD